MHMTTLMLIILLLVTIARMLFWLGSHSITVLFIIRSCLSLFMAVATLHKVGSLLHNICTYDIARLTTFCTEYEHSFSVFP